MNKPTRIFITVLSILGCLLTVVLSTIGAQLFGSLGFVVCVAISLMVILILAKLHLDNTDF